MNLTEAVSFLTLMLAQFPWASVEAKTLGDLLEQQASCGLGASHAGEDLKQELLPEGYTTGTGLYEGVVTELPTMCLLCGHISLQPCGLCGVDAEPDQVSHGLEIGFGNAVSVEEGTEALERSHAEVNHGN